MKRILTCGSKSHTSLERGDLIRWDDAEDGLTNLCFDLRGDHCHGEILVMIDGFRWSELERTPTFHLEDAELASSFIELDERLNVVDAGVNIESFSEGDDLVIASFAGRCRDESGGVQKFAARSDFRVLRPSKYVEYWSDKLTGYLGRSLPGITSKCVVTEPSHYGARYGDDYFYQFIYNVAGKEHIGSIQLIFENADRCQLYISKPNDPSVFDDYRTFDFIDESDALVAALSSMLGYQGGGP